MEERDVRKQALAEYRIMPSNAMQEKSKEGGGKTLPRSNATLMLEGWLRVGQSLSRQHDSMRGSL